MANGDGDLADKGNEAGKERRLDHGGASRNEGNSGEDRTLKPLHGQH
jgi:hypothetical protein